MLASKMHIVVGPTWKQNDIFPVLSDAWPTEANENKTPLREDVKK